MAKISIKQRVNTMSSRMDQQALLPILAALPLVQVLTGSAVFDPASLIDGAGATTTVIVTGAALGDYVPFCSFSLDLQGITVTAWVSAANTVSVRLQNETGGTLDLASGTLRVGVVPFGSLVSSNTNQIIP